MSIFMQKALSQSSSLREAAFILSGSVDEGKKHRNDFCIESRELFSLL